MRIDSYQEYLGDMMESTVRTKDLCSLKGEDDDREKGRALLICNEPNSYQLEEVCTPCRE